MSQVIFAVFQNKKNSKCHDWAMGLNGPTMSAPKTNKRRNGGWHSSEIGYQLFSFTTPGHRTASCLELASNFAVSRKKPEVSEKMVILRSLFRSVRARSYVIAGVTHRNLLQSHHQAARSFFSLSSHRSSFSDFPLRVSSGIPPN